MNGFETFSVQSWLSDCLSRHPVEKQSSSQLKRSSSSSFRIGMLMPIVACGALSFLSLSNAAIASGLDPSAHIVAAVADSDLIQGSPVKFWSKAIADVSGWESVAEQEIETPDLLF